MTTRRSRLKAVANLPVRRKIAVQGPADDVSSKNNNATESDSIFIGRNERNERNTIHNNDSFKNTQNIPNIVDNKKNNISDYVNDNNNGSKCNMVNKCLQNPQKEISIEACSEEEGKINSTENDNLVGTDLDIINKSSQLQIDCSDNSELCENTKSCTPEMISSSKVTDVDECISKSDNQTEVSLNCKISNHKDSSVNLGEVNSFVLITSDYENKNLNSNITNSPSSLNSFTLTSLSNMISQNVNDEYNVPLYKNIVEQTDLFVNMPQLVDSKDITPNQTLIDAGEGEPILTTLVNCYTGSNISSMITDSETDENRLLPSHEEPQGLYLNNVDKNASVIEIINYSQSNNISKNINNPVDGNVIINTLGYQKSQDNIYNKNATSKKSVAAVKRKRSKCSDFTKKLADARKEFQKKFEKTKPDRSTLKMIDLIFYNPTTNPMESKCKADEKEDGLQGELIQEVLAEQEADEPQSVEFGSQSVEINSLGNSRMPVPQLKIDCNGEIILDEKSVIIETSDARKGREDLMKNPVPIFEDKGSRVSYYKGKNRKTKDWTDFETKRFYKALNTIGPDFSLMQKYFPKRSRLELKNKFKREERLNRSLIDKALINPAEFDMTQLENDLAVERKAEQREIEMKLNKAIKEKQNVRRIRTKSSLFSREMIECDEKRESLQSENVISHKLYQNEKDKKKKELGFIFQKFVLNEFEKDINEPSGISTSTSEIFFSSNYHSVA